MNTLFSTQSLKAHYVIINVLTVLIAVLFYASIHAQEEKLSNVLVNKYYGYNCELPKGMFAQDSNNDGVRIEIYKDSKIAMIITAFSPNPIGSVATFRGITKSNDVTLKQRIIIDLTQSRKPRIQQSEFLENIDWSFPIVGGEKALQANGSFLEICDGYPFPLTMVKKGKNKIRFTNVRLSVEEFEQILSSIEFFEVNNLDTSDLGGN